MFCGLNHADLGNKTLSAGVAVPKLSQIETFEYSAKIYLTWLG